MTSPLQQQSQAPSIENSILLPSYPIERFPLLGAFVVVEAELLQVRFDVLRRQEHGLGRRCCHGVHEHFRGGLLQAQLEDRRRECVVGGAFVISEPQESDERMSRSMHACVGVVTRVNRST